VYDRRAVMGKVAVIVEGLAGYLIGNDYGLG
jgi:hypothetical protein